MDEKDDQWAEEYRPAFVAALLDNYRDGHEFANLLLVVDRAGEIVPHRTVYAGEDFALRIDESAGGRPSSRLGSYPWRSWASTWNRLTARRTSEAASRTWRATTTGS